jgi:ADP-ribose pyrophosphatase YjhB (NUDIX family)
MKIFLNEKTIELLSSNPGTPLPSEMIIEYKSPGQLKRTFKAFEKDELHLKLILWSKIKDVSLKTNFLRMFKNIDAGGGLVKNERGERLFIFRLGKWDLPKGKLSGKESAKEAAIREVKEETGLQKVKITGTLPSTWHIYSGKGKQILKQTHWFEMKANSNQPLIPQTEEDISDVRWFRKENIGIVLENTYGSIKEIIPIPNT